MVSDTRERSPAHSVEREAARGEATYAQLIAELREYVVYYAAVRVDQAQHAVLRTALAIGLAAVVFVVAGGMVLTASVLTLGGIAAGLGEALGGRLWLGCLLTGAAVLFAVAVALGAMSCFLQRSWHKRMKEKYETRRDAQRVQFGRDIAGSV